MAAEEGAVLRQLALLANHKSVGMTILVLAVVRLVWRASHPAPILPQEMPTWQRVAAHVTHWALYACLFLLPLSGWLMSSASAYTVSWFNLLELPDLVAPSETLKERLLIVHEGVAKGLFIVALLHIGAAFKHMILDRDDVLRRMTGAASLSGAIAVLAIGLFLLVPGSASEREVPASDQAATDASTSVSQVHHRTSEVARWQVDYEASAIEFVGQQAGASFTGRWTRWEADIRFDPDRLSQSRAEVVIHTAAVDSADTERDSTIIGPDFLHAMEFPTATFVATSFVAIGDDRFTATGALRIKAIEQPVEFTFAIAQADGVTRLTGTAEIDRLAFAVGLGDWQDTTWVGQFVEVVVLVTAAR